MLRKIGNTSLTFFVIKRLSKCGTYCVGFCCFGKYKNNKIEYSKYNHQFKNYAEII